MRATCFHAGTASTAGAGANSVPACQVAGARPPRSAARPDARQHHLLVNFSRTTLSDDNTGGGHFSPLAAYNRTADDLLLMDVARYKYPPFWVDAELLRQAMATTDTTSGRHRGFNVVDVDK